MFIASNFKFYLLKTQVPTEQEKGPRPKRRGQEEVGRVWGSQKEGCSRRGSQEEGWSGRESLPGLGNFNLEVLLLILVEICPNFWPYSFGSFWD